MTIQTIKVLNQLNQQFYQKVAASFSATRKNPWLGWEQCLAFIRQVPSPLTVVDVACGNGRFGEFLEKNTISVTHYTGIENNQVLLDEAKSRVTTTGTFKKVDIVETLLDGTWGSHLPPASVITLFGLVHHVPSLALRQQLLAESWDKVLPGGLLIFTTWQFKHLKRFSPERLSSIKVTVRTEDLEGNDYFLDWDANAASVRYCHLVDDKEVQRLLPAVDNLVANFSADGQDGKTNHYYILRKPLA